MFLKTIIALFLCLFFCLNSFSQNIITGKVYDLESKEPLDSYNVSLINKKDSSILMAGNFINEIFKINCPKENEFIIEISSFGYKTQRQEYLIESNTFNLGSFFLEKTIYNLGEVVVEATPPRLIHRDDKLVILVENSTISNAGTAIDALQRTPLVLFDNITKSISLAGKENVLILINGKRLNNEQELNLLNSSQIKQIEIIENPSAKYEADGHGVINIVTVKQTIEGLSGSLFTNLSFDRKTSQNASLDLTYNTNKILLNGQYSFGNYHSQGYNTTIENYEKSSYSFNSINDDIKNHYFMRIHNYKLGFEYEINKYNIINIETSGFWGDGGNNTYSSLDITKNGNKNVLEYINRNGQDNPYRNTISIGYGLNKDKINLSLIGDYTKSKNRLIDDIQETDSLNSYNNILNSISKSDYNLYTLRSDFNIPLKPLKSSIEFGGKYSNVLSDDDLVFSRLINNNWSVDKDFSNYVQLKEEILGLYGLISGNINKFDYSLGLRYERSWTKNRWKNEENKELCQIENNFFPNLSLSYKLKDDLSLRLSYTRRINRPSYSSLNNSLKYLNTYSSTQGNPNLKSTIYNSIGANISYKQISSSLTFSYLENPIDMLYINDSIQIEKHTIKYLNVKNRWMIAYTLSASFNKGIWSTQPFAAFEYSPYSIIEDDVTYTTKRLMVYLRSNNQISLRNNFSIDFNLLYRKPAHSFKIFGDQLVLDYGLNKSFFNNKLIFQLSHHLEFLKWTQKMNYGYKNIDFTFDASNRNRVSLSIRYVFKSTKKKYSGKSSNSEEIKRL